MSKSLKYFMRENAKSEEIVKVPGIKSITNENGNVVDFEIKILSIPTIRKIQNNYKTKSVAVDSKGNPYIQNGEVVWKTEKDNDKSLSHIIVEALQYPNLKDKELMAYFNCTDITEMPSLVFPKTDEFNEVSKIVMKTLGIIDIPSEESEIEDAKN